MSWSTTGNSWSLENLSNLKKGDIVGVYTQKGEAVALAEATMSEEEIQDATKGYAFETKRIIMAPQHLS